MNRGIVLDSGVLGLLTHPRPSEESRACSAWLRALASEGDACFISELADYEIRREYLRRHNRAGIDLLDSLIGQLIYLPLETRHWRLAAAL